MSDEAALKLRVMELESILEDVQADYDGLRIEAEQAAKDARRRLHALNVIGDIARAVQYGGAIATVEQVLLAFEEFVRRREADPKTRKGELAAYQASVDALEDIIAGRL